MHTSNTVRLGACRKRAGLDQAELAHLAGVHVRSGISRLETGSRLPDARTLIAYELLFGHKAQTLLPDTARGERRRILSFAKLLLRRIDRSVVSQPKAKIAFLKALIARLEGGTE